MIHEEISCCIGRLGCGGVSAERGVNGMLWERVTADQQAAEIRQTRPSTSDQPTEASQIRPYLVRAHYLVFFPPILLFSSDLSQPYGDGFHLGV
jgi:hypothetical protein